MTTIPLELPDELTQFVATRVANGEFSSPNDYIVALIDGARRSRDETERLLLDDLESGPSSEWNTEDVVAIRQRIIERHGAN
jgi:Arc/MetJ-type ribon-helix-helix transcriptional regulator